MIEMVVREIAGLTKALLDIAKYMKRIADTLDALSYEDAPGQYIIRTETRIIEGVDHAEKR